VVKSGNKYPIFTIINYRVVAAYIGEYHCKVDSKGRIMLPAAFKRQMASGSQDRFVVRKDIYESCLVLYPMDEWQRQNKIIRANTNPYNKEHNAFVRGFFKGAAEIELDASNRMLIPKRLLEETHIETEVVLAWQDGKIEIWSEKVYDKTVSGDEFAVLAEKIMGGTINDINE
jgi:MraZ protein